MTSKRESTLPRKGVMFMGGHPNMVKKLRQRFPKWTYVALNELRRKTSVRPKVVFHWSNHSSHMMEEWTFSKMPPNTKSHVIYLKSTNLNMLIDEMEELYSATIS